MIQRQLFISFSICSILICSCAPPYGVNKEITIIGDLNTTCLEKDAWSKLENEYSIDGITNPKFKNGLKEIQHHFLNLDHILYFPEGPEEIVGCDYYSARLAFNPELSNLAFSGMNKSIPSKELIRIRNRIQKLLKKHQCKDGQNESDELMQKPVRED